MVNTPAIFPLDPDRHGDRGYALEWKIGDYDASIEVETDRKPVLHVVDLKTRESWYLDCNKNPLDDSVIERLTSVFHRSNLGGVVGGTQHQIKAVITELIKIMEE
jgi:hypothetical protein